jgi:DNA-directed RNA polymerase subunit H (RpoH/RPB5)
MSKQIAFEICIQMLEQRGYSIVHKDKEELNIQALKPNDDKMIVIFNSLPKFDSKSMKEVISIMSEYDVNHSLVIYEDDITAATKNSLSQTNEMRVELFSEEDLQYNITKHRLQPQFERLSVEKGEEFKKEYGSKFGTLRADKPISRFYDYEKGDVIKITREGGYITYRIVR